MSLLWKCKVKSSKKKQNLLRTQTTSKHSAFDLSHSESRPYGTIKCTVLLHKDVLISVRSSLVHLKWVNNLIELLLLLVCVCLTKVFGPKRCFLKKNWIKGITVCRSFFYFFDVLWSCTWLRYFWMCVLSPFI